MQISDAKYTDDNQQGLSAVVDGVRVFIPCDPRNRHYRELMKQKVVIAAYVPLPRTKPDAEALRERVETLEAEITALKQARGAKND